MPSRIGSAKNLTNVAQRGHIVSTINVFSVDDWLDNPDEFISLITNEINSFPFDHYDTAFLVEESIKSKWGPKYYKFSDDWHTLWNEIFSYTDAEVKIKNFWLKKIPDPLLPSTLVAIKPFRKRACWQFIVDKKTNAEWIISDLGRPVFKQDTGDSRSRERRFHPFPATIRDDQMFLDFIASACQMVHSSISYGSNSFKITAHIMRTYAETGGQRPAPEGIHQDGADYIVSAMVLDRENVFGGTSSIFYDQGKLIALEEELKIGQGILQADKSLGLWHGVSPVHPYDNNKISYRSILGLDIDLIR